MTQTEHSRRLIELIAFLRTPTGRMLYMDLTDPDCFAKYDAKHGFNATTGKYEQPTETYTEPMTNL